MVRKVIGITLLVACLVGLIGEVVALRELCDSDYFYSDDRWLIRGAQAWVLTAPFVAFVALRLLWNRGGWAGWFTSIGSALLVGALTYGAALLSAVSGSSCRIHI